MIDGALMTDWPILVLSLPGDEVRRAPLLDRLEAEGLAYTLFMGVDGRRGLPPEFESMIDREGARSRLGRDMSDGEFACALSHRAICQQVIDHGLEGAIVLEDDVQLKPGFAGFIRSGDYRRVPMVMIDYAFGRAVRFRRIRVAQGELRRAAVQSTMASAYSVNRGVAAKLVEANTPIISVADWPLELFDIGAWLMVPRLTRHDPPGAALSHLHAERTRLVSETGTETTARRVPFLAWLRRKLSVRVDRARGQR